MSKRGIGKRYNAHEKLRYQHKTADTQTQTTIALIVFYIHMNTYIKRVKTQKMRESEIVKMVIYDNCSPHTCNNNIYYMYIFSYIIILKHTHTDTLDFQQLAFYHTVSNKKTPENMANAFTIKLIIIIIILIMVNTMKKEK